MDVEGGSSSTSPSRTWRSPSSTTTGTPACPWRPSTSASPRAALRGPSSIPRRSPAAGGRTGRRCRGGPPLLGEDGAPAAGDAAPGAPHRARGDPSRGVCEPLVLSYTGCLAGLDPPAENRVTFQGQEVRPGTGSCTVLGRPLPEDERGRPGPLAVLLLHERRGGRRQRMNSPRESLIMIHSTLPRAPAHCGARLIAKTWLCARVTAGRTR
jgi:hypothetical protein